MTYNQLKKEFDKKVKNLQEKCPHKKTQLRVEWWAYGHATGHTLKVCLTCNKRLERN